MIVPCEPRMILIPAGPFLMGSDPKRDKWASNNECPAHTVNLPAFYIAQVPVTLAEFYVFMQAQGLGDADVHDWLSPGPDDRRGRWDDHPVVGKSDAGALAYCEWLSKATGKPYRLPTEAEWEKAARGTDGRIYPWGDNEVDGPQYCKWYLDYATNSISNDTVPVGQYPLGASPYGVLDMAGNVCELTSSTLRPYPYDRNDGREDGHPPHVCRGGWYASEPEELRCAMRWLPNWVGFGRNEGVRTTGFGSVGFRLAMDAPADARPVSGECIICGARLSTLDRLAGRQRCKQHR